MPLARCSTLTQFLIEERRRYPTASGDFNALVLDVALACTTLARRVALCVLSGPLGAGFGGPLSGAHHALHHPSAQDADGAAHEGMGHAIFVAANHWGGRLAGMASTTVGQPGADPRAAAAWQVWCRAARWRWRCRSSSRPSFGC